MVNKFQFINGILLQSMIFVINEVLNLTKEYSSYSDKKSETMSYYA